MDLCGFLLILCSFELICTNRLDSSGQFFVCPACPLVNISHNLYLNTYWNSQGCTA